MGNRVYVGNLSYNTSQDSLEKAFSRSGTVTEAKVMIDRETGRSRGFGFVAFASDDQASQAIQDWNGQDLDGRRIVVNEAQERKSGSGSGPGRFEGRAPIQSSRSFGSGNGGNGFSGNGPSGGSGGGDNGRENKGRGRGGRGERGNRRTWQDRDD